MSDLIVMTFDNADEASNVRKALKNVQNSGHLLLDDSAVIVKDEDGQVHVRNEVDRGIKVGIAGGGLLGLFIGFLFGGPIGSLLVGGIAGSVIGSMADLGVRQDFVNDVRDSLKPDSSALFILVRDAHPEVVLAALKPYKGTVIQTTLETEAEESLRQVLDMRSS